MTDEAKNFKLDILKSIVVYSIEDGYQVFNVFATSATAQSFLQQMINNEKENLKSFTVSSDLLADKPDDIQTGQQVRIDMQIVQPSDREYQVESYINGKFYKVIRKYEIVESSLLDFYNKHAHYDFWDNFLAIAGNSEKDLPMQEKCDVLMQIVQAKEKIFKK